jgi:hypothetical protein
MLRYMHDHMVNFSGTGGIAGTKASAQSEPAENDIAVGKPIELLAPEGKQPVQCAEGPDVKPLHDGAWWRTRLL